MKRNLFHMVLVSRLYVEKLTERLSRQHGFKNTSANKYAMKWTNTHTNWLRHGWLVQEPSTKFLLNLYQIMFDWKFSKECSILPTLKLLQNRCKYFLLRMVEIFLLLEFICVGTKTSVQAAWIRFENSKTRLPIPAPFDGSGVDFVAFWPSNNLGLNTICKTSGRHVEVYFGQVVEVFDLFFF